MGCSDYVEKRTIVRDFGSMRKAGQSPMGDNDRLPQAQADSSLLPLWRHQAAVLRAFDDAWTVIGHNHTALGAFVGVGGCPHRYGMKDGQ